MADDEVPVHDIQQEQPAESHEIRVLLEDSHVRRPVVVSQRCPQIHCDIEGPLLLGDRILQPAEIAREEFHMLRDAAPVRELLRALHEGGREIDTDAFVPHLREVDDVAANSAWGVQDACARLKPEFFEEGVDVLGLILSKVEGMLVDRDPQVCVLQEQCLGPMGSVRHRLAIVHGRISAW